MDRPGPTRSPVPGIPTSRECPYRSADGDADDADRPGPAPRVCLVATLPAQCAAPRGPRPARSRGVRPAPCSPRGDGPRNPQDRKEALNRIAWILLNKGGQIRDITIGDCIEISDALQEHQCQGANNRPLFYALLAETGVLPAGAPPVLRATRMAGQRTPVELVGKYGLHSQAMRDLLTSYLAERAAELDYASLVRMANTLCGLFWRDLEQHHPGISSLHLDPEVAAAWKERLRQVRDQDGRLIGDRATARSQLLIVRAFYLDIAQWAAEDPSRWARWSTPCPIKASECSMDKERKRLKAAMDQRTRARLPVLPALVRTADQERKARLDAALPATPGQVVDVHGEKLQRRNAVAGRIYVTDLATGR